MARFEAGKYYACNDCSISPILIIKRTAKMCAVQNDNGTQWRMLIRTAGDNEYMIDTAVPKKWRELYTYDARFEEKRGQHVNRRTKKSKFKISKNTQRRI